MTDSEKSTYWDFVYKLLISNFSQLTEEQALKGMLKYKEEMQEKNGRDDEIYEHSVEDTVKIIDQNGYIEQNCIVCDKILKMEYTNPMDGTLWTSNGNWGSTVYDSMGDKFLVAIICDECLVKKKHLIIEKTIKIKKEYTSESFEKVLKKGNI